MAQSNSLLQVYGGDEVAAIVLDPGSETTRIGYAGEDCPRLITPSYIGFDISNSDDGQMDIDAKTTANSKISKRSNTYLGEEALNFARPNKELKPIIKDGLIQDWDSAIEQWDYLFEKLYVDFDEQPLLLTEPVWNTTENRTQSLEVALETFGFPGFYLASTPTCVAFAHGRPSALVVDIGRDIVSVTPVVDGMCLAKTTLKTHYAGNFLTHQLQNKFKKFNEDIIPRFRVKSKVLTNFVEAPSWTPNQFDGAITKSYEDFQISKTLLEIKETLLKVQLDPIDPNEKEFEPESYPKRSYESPNGHIVEFAKERFEVADSLFEPGNYPTDEFPAESGEPEIQSKNDYVPLKRAKKTEDDEDSTPAPVTTKRSKKEVPKYRGLSELTSHALSLVDVDIKAQLAHNIIVTGASSLIPGLTERLYQDLTKANPALKIRLHASGNSAERKFQSWIGGSVLSSLGTFHQLWVSKKELEEVGVDKLLTQRFR